MILIVNKDNASLLLLSAIIIIIIIIIIIMTWGMTKWLTLFIGGIDTSA
jgi:hypothetical protein